MPKQPEPKHVYCVAERVPGHLRAPASKLARFGAYVENENTIAKGGKDASSSTPH